MILFLPLPTRCHHVSKPQQAPRLLRPSLHSQPELRAFHVDMDCPQWAAKDVGDGTVSVYTAGRAAVLGPDHTAGSLRELWDPAGTPAPPQGSQPRTLGWGLGSALSWFSVRPAAVTVPGALWMFHHERVGHRWSSWLPGGRAGVVGCKVKVRSLAVPWGF